MFGAPTVHRPSHPSTRRGEGVNVSGADASHGCRAACTRTRVDTQHTSVMHHPRVESGTPQGPADAPLDGPPRQGCRSAHGRSFHRAAATACTVPGAGPTVLPARLTAPRASGQDGPWRLLARSCHTSLHRPFTVPCPNPVAEFLANAANHVGSRDDTLRGCARRRTASRAGTGLPAPRATLSTVPAPSLAPCPVRPPCAGPCAPRISRIEPCTRQWNHSPAPRDRSATCTAPPQRGSVEISCPDPAGELWSKVVYG